VVDGVGVITFNNPDPTNIRNKPEMGGGSIPDIGVYAYSCVRFAARAEPGELRAVIHRENDVDTFAQVTGEMISDKGRFTYGAMTSTRLHPRQEAVLQGSEGLIRLTCPFNANVFDQAEVTLIRKGKPDEVIRYPGVNQYVIQVEAFARHVTEGAPYMWTLEDARGMLWTALEDPDPVLIFENVMLYNMTGQIAANAGPVDIDKAAIRRAGKDISLITYGGSLWKTLEAAEVLAGEGIEAEVIDLRSLRPLDDETIMASLARTRRAVIVDEGWRSGSLSAEIAARIGEQAFWHLDAPVGRVCSTEVPIPYPKHLEDAAIPQVPAIVTAVKATLGKG